MFGIDNKNKSEKGMTLLEALVSTAIIGIGFVAVFQMVNYSVQSVDVSGERTKASIRPIEITIIKISKIYFGAFDVIENILFGSKFFNI